MLRQVIHGTFPFELDAKFVSAPVSIEEVASSGFLDSVPVLLNQLSKDISSTGLCSGKIRVPVLFLYTETVLQFC